MKEIFNQIHRYTEQTFEEGKPFEFTLNRKDSNDNKRLEPHKNVSNDKMEVGNSYKITVKKYMTEPATSNFDFQDKWNNGIPMPFVIMRGEVIKETRGMYYMDLHAEAEQTSVCLCCGRPLKNKISMLYGLGPECGNHAYINPFDTEEELNEHLEEVKLKIREVKWSGWVIKSAIKKWEVI